MISPTRSDRVAPSCQSHDVAFQSRLTSSRRAAIAAVGETLAFGFDLVPPSARPGIATPPTPAPALQMTTQLVALDGRAIARVAAIDSAAVRQSVVHDVSNATAAALTHVESAIRPDLGEPTDLGVIADRRVPWSRVATVLGLAREAGVARVQLLLSRGQMVAIPSNAPREAGFLLPTDFVAIDAVLADEGFSPAGDLAYDAAVAELPQAGTEPVALAAPKR